MEKKIQKIKPFITEKDSICFQKKVDQDSIDISKLNSQSIDQKLLTNISHSPLFKYIQQMPKGSLLHGHITAMVKWSTFLHKIISIDELKENIFYLKSPQALRYFLSKKTNLSGSDKNTSPWNVPSGFKKNALTFIETSDNAFDITVIKEMGWERLDHRTAQIIARQLSESHKQSEQNENGTWELLKMNRSLPWSLVKHNLVFPHYFRYLLEGAIENGLQHIELKTNLGNMYTKWRSSQKKNIPVFEGRWLSNEEEIQLIRRVYNEYKDKISLRIILGAHRSSLPKSLCSRFRVFLDLYKKHNDIISGVDIFGMEDQIGSRSNRDFIECLKMIEGSGMMISIHSGEKAIIDVPTDDNLYSLLDLRDVNIRVGHGLSLWKYPDLEDKYLRSNIHIELCPLSNIFLGYIDKISNHPGFRYYKRGLNISISPDDPAFFGYDNVSYEWYMIVKEWKLKLEDVVCICMNSIEASGVSSIEKKALKRSYKNALLQFLN